MLFPYGFDPPLKEENEKHVGKEEDVIKEISSTSKCEDNAVCTANVKEMKLSEKLEISPIQRIMTESSEQQEVARFLPRRKEHQQIFVPDFRQINEQENPLLWDNVQPGATNLATAQILETHPELEQIEDMVKFGHEKRVTGPASLLRVFNEHPQYGLDKGEEHKLAHYQVMTERTIIARNWPKRVYDYDNLPMTTQQQNQFNQMFSEWKKEIEYRIEMAKGLHRDTEITQKRRRTARKMNEMITESDSDTDNEDFSF